MSIWFRALDEAELNHSTETEESFTTEGDTEIQNHAMVRAESCHLVLWRYLLVFRGLRTWVDIPSHVQAEVQPKLNLGNP